MTSSAEQMNGLQSRLPGRAGYRSMGHLLHARAALCDRSKGYSFDFRGSRSALAWQDLQDLARVRAQVLTSATLPHDRIVLACQLGPDYVINLFACLIAGRIAVPAYPPRGRRHAAMLDAIIADCAPALIILDPDLLGSDAANRLADGQANLMDAAVGPKEAAIRLAGDDQLDSVTGSDIAILQYTSGSTSRPRGVCQTHQNLLHNLAWQQRLYNVSGASRAVIWLPPYHDMGLGSGIFQPLFSDSSVLLLDPKAVARDPSIWLRAICDFGADISGGPTFAYDLAVKGKSRSPERYRDIGLSNWKTAFIGAEPIHVQTLASFAEAFSGNGFSPAGFVPSYGLAESTLLATGRRGVHTSAVGGEDRVSCGRSSGLSEVRIVDPASGTVLPAGEEGEIWLASPSVAAGYWGQGVDETTFKKGIPGDSRTYLATGDMGILIGGDLYITGRIKNTLIVNGRNIHLEDVEKKSIQLTCQSIENFTTAVAVPVMHGQQQQLCLCLEVQSHIFANPEKLEQISLALRREISAFFDIGVAHVAFERSGLLPRTSSGKVARQQCRELIAQLLPPQEPKS